MKIIYSFNKKGFEADYWQREIAAASDDRHTFIPFNHDSYLPVSRYIRAQLLDDLYFQKDPRLLRMYADFEELIRIHGAAAVIVDNCFPYHPDYLRTIPIYKVLRTSDGPISAYDRDFAYLHAYDHVLFHSPAYSEVMGMEEKLHYCGARRTDFWPLALFDAAFDPSKSTDELAGQRRDLDVVFVGSMFLNKMPLLARMKKAFGSRFILHGQTNWKRNLYFNAKFGVPGWVRPIAFERYIPLYQRARVGINIHNRGDYTVGNYRMFDLAGNGVLQISDGGSYLTQFFEPGHEILGFESPDDLIDKVRYYLAHDDERKTIVRNAHARVMRDHRFAARMRSAGSLIERGMSSR